MEKKIRRQQNRHPTPFSMDSSSDFVYFVSNRNRSAKIVIEPRRHKTLLNLCMTACVSARAHTRIRSNMLLRTYVGFSGLKDSYCPLVIVFQSSGRKR